MVRPRGQNDMIVGTSLVIASWRNKRNGKKHLVRRDDCRSFAKFSEALPKDKYWNCEDFDSERLDLQIVLLELSTHGCFTTQL